MIRVFYHIAFLNHWEDVVREQIAMIENSGLYSACEKIHIGCVGSSEERMKLEEIIKSKEKFVIDSYNSDIKKYEFITLKLVKRFADELPPFNVCYIHTKGVSYADKEISKTWRDYCNYYTIWHWSKNVVQLKNGNDLCGIQPKEKNNTGQNKFHFAGNMWWATSTYIKTLKKVETLNYFNRWEAEFWIGSEKPKWISLSNWNCSAGTKGDFPRTQYQESKVHIITPYDINKNLGKVYNEEMARIPENDFACITDIDTLFLTSDAGNILHNYANLYPDTGIFTCWTNRIYPKGILQLLNGKANEDSDIRNHIKLAEEQKKQLYKTTEIKVAISGMLMMISKKTWNEIKFNEDLKCLGVDNDYSIRIRNSGRKILRMESLYLFHIYRLTKEISDVKHLQ